MDTLPNGERIFPSSSSSYGIACMHLHLHRCPTWWGSHQASFQWSLVSAASLQKFKQVSKEEGFFHLNACKCRFIGLPFPSFCIYWWLLGQPVGVKGGREVGETDDDRCDDGCESEK